MNGTDLTEGTLVKGKDLNGMALYKILPEDMKTKGFQYQIGENTDTNPLDTEGICRRGLYFTDSRNIAGFKDHGEKLAIIEIPDEEDVYVDNKKFRTHKLIIKRAIPLSPKAAWEHLIKNGYNITAENNWAIRYAAGNGDLETVRYLHENGADTTANNNVAVINAAANGHLETVRYLHENGADITANSNSALIYAAYDGNLDMIRYLHENGADVTACGNAAVLNVAMNGHFKAVEYLQKNGATVI